MHGVKKEFFLIGQNWIFFCVRVCVCVLVYTFHLIFHEVAANEYVSIVYIYLYMHIYLFLFTFLLTS